MRCGLLISRSDFEKSAPEYEQLSFLTNENCPNVQENLTYKRTATINDCITTRNYERLVKFVARRLDFNMHLKGTEYFIDTILFLFENELSVRQCDLAFEIIGNKENLTIKQVRKRIINSLNAMENSAKKSVIYEFFPEYDGRNPSLMYSLTLALESLEDVFK